MAGTTIEGSQADCEQQAARIIAEKLTDIAAKKGRVVLGLSSSTSLKGVFTQLLVHNVPWKNVQIFMTDDACVSVHSLESQYRAAEHAFINQLIESKKLPPANVHPYVYNPDNSFGSQRHYDNDHVKQGGVFDIILMEAGKDGHIASLFPKHHTIKNEATRFFLMHDAPLAPLKRLTSSKKLLLKASVGILMCSGADKEKVWTAINQATTSPIDCPAKLITQLPDYYLIHPAL